MIPTVKQLKSNGQGTHKLQAMTCPIRHYLAVPAFCREGLQCCQPAFRASCLSGASCSLTKYHQHILPVRKHCEWSFRELKRCSRDESIESYKRCGALFRPRNKKDLGSIGQLLLVMYAKCKDHMYSLA
jgi:hypothetical protein